jgi:regulator of protease activity HflC (stomatin/prohibitin superfamily)
VLSYEAVIVRDPTGKVTIHQNSLGGTRFFLPAYSDIVTMYWSSYGQDAKNPGEKVPVARIDMRERKMFYTYEVRTNDNVRLLVNGTIFWKVLDVGKMVSATADPEGDVWQKSRSALIQAVSATNFQDFMASVNNVTLDAFNKVQLDTFLDDRGVSLEQLELTGFECLDTKTAVILRDIIQETINGVKRKETQASENDVKKVKMSGDIVVEQQRTQLIDTLSTNSKLKAATEGEASALRMVAGVAVFIQGLNTSVPNVTDRVELYKLRERKQARNADTAVMGTSSGTLFLEPGQANLNLAALEL